MKFAISAVFAVSLFLIAPLAFLMTDNLPPYEYDPSRSYIVPSHTEAGRQIIVHWYITRINRVCPGSITRHIVDQQTGLRVSYDPTPSARNLEVEDKYLDRTFFLPTLITPGMKWYYAEGEYACNPLQRFYPLRVRTPRISFEVTE